MNTVKITSISKCKTRIEVRYKSEGLVSTYLKQSEECYWAEYNENIESVPDSIAVIPFVANVLPICWTTDAELIVPELDNEFYESTFDVKHGLKLMANQITFKGLLTVEKLVDNRYPVSHDSLVLFSGGVDAFATLFARLPEKPQMLTIWGADVGLLDTAGWDVVCNHVISTSSKFGLDNPVFVKSNFRLVVEEGKLGEYTACYKDGWWHAIQHGLAITSFAAPIAYLRKARCVYIASSYTIDDNVVCASDPVTDSLVRYGATYVRHDRFCFDRTRKVESIVKTCESLQMQIQLRVCWQSLGGHNCCECEKCIRTIFNILSVGGNPIDYGFEYKKEVENRYKNIIQEYIYSIPHLLAYWENIQHTFLTNGFCKNDSRINWIYTYDFKKQRPLKQRIKIKVASILRKFVL